MKKRLFILALMTVTLLTVVNGATRDEFQRDIRRSANNYWAYPDKDLPALSPAPAGYEPFFINHYARHGSRWLIVPTDYSYPVEELTKAEQAGKLTPRGREVLAVCRDVLEKSRGRLGELTSLGAEQHQGIARRMGERFPMVFSNGAIVDARSTVVIRCILSMQNEINQLQAMFPDLVISCDAAQNDMFYLNFYPDKDVDDAREKAFKLIPDFKKKHFNPQSVLNRLFNDKKWVARNIDGPKLVTHVFDVVSNLQSHHEWESLDMYKGVFSVDDVYNIWQCNNARWYARSGYTPLNDYMGAWSQRNLLRDFINRADRAISRGEHGAAMRFGHEGNVLPLVSLMGLNGMDYATTDLETLADCWPSYTVFPMACNVQMIFYRNATDGDILVKILLNEREATVPAVATDCAPYYHWQDLRDHFMRRISKQ